MIQIKTKQTEKELRVSCPYNPDVIEAFRSRGGKWDANAKEWVFANGAAKNGLIAVDELFGLSDEVVTVQVGKELWRGYQHVSVGGYLLASRRGRDYGADLVETLVSGTIPKSGGSVKNPAVALDNDCVFELEVRKDFAERFELIPPTICEPSHPLAAFTKEELEAELSRRA